MATLGNLIEQVRGVSYKPEDLHPTLNENSIPLLRANNIKDGKLNFDEVVYVDRKKVSDKQLIRAGDILVCASSGSKDLVGKAAYIEADLQITFGAFCKIVRPLSECPQYIGHFFNSPYYRERISNYAAGANINNIRNEHIDGLEITWPSLEKRYEVVTVLDKISELIALRKEQLAKLNELVKARFVEMFGDPIENVMQWHATDLNQVCTKITDGEHGSVSRTTSGHYFLNAKHVKKNGTIDWITATHVDNEIHKKIYARCNPEPDDILLTTTGTIGNVAIVPNVEPFSMDRGITLLKLNKEIIDKDFLSVLLNFECIQNVMKSNVHASAIGHLFLNQVMRIPVIVPPIKVQRQFSTFVEQTNKTKLTIQASLDKLEIMKKALMQEYFG